MSKNNRILIVLFVVLVVLFIAIRQSRDPRERRIRFFDVNPEQITAIELTTSRDTLKVSKDDFHWMLELPFESAINQSRLDSFFNRVLPIQTSSIPVSVNPDAFSGYQVDEGGGTKVTLYDRNNRILTEAVIGRSGGNAYARRVNEEEVYRLTENIATFVSPNLFSWRSNDIVAIPETSLTKINVNYSLNEYTLERVNTKWEYRDSDKNITIHDLNPSLIKILDLIGSMTNYGFIDFEYEDYAEKLAEPDLILEIERRDGATVKLTFAHNEENTFVVQKDNVTDHLYLIDDETVNAFTISPERFEVSVTN